MDFSWRKIVGLIAVAVAILLLATGVRHLSRSNDRLPVQQVRPGEDKHGSPGRAANNRLRPKLAGTYGLDYRFRFEAPTKNGGRTAATLRWTGTLRLAELPDHPGWIGLRAGSDMWQGNAALQSVTGVKNADQPLLQSPFVARLDGSGQVEELRFARRTPVPLQALLGAVTYAMQWIRPQGVTGDTWQTQERDLTGRYSATYTTTAKNEVTKSWRGSGAEPGASHPLGLQQDTSAKYELDGTHVQRLNWVQRGHMLSPFQAAAARTEFRIALNLVRQTDEAAAWVSGLDPQRMRPLRAAMAEQREARAAEPLDLAGAINQISTLSGADVLARRADVRRRIIAGLRNEPTLVAKAEAALRQGQVGELAERTLLEAFVGAATAPAQRALSNLISDPKVAELLRDRALIAATLLQGANVGFVDTLLATAQKEPDRGSAVAVTLGALSRDLAAEQPQRARKLVAKLVTQVTRGGKQGATGETPRSLRDECNWLAALGNSGDPQALPAIKKALDDSRQEVRASAAHALRFQDPAATHDTMVLRMAAEESFGVRLGLLHAARWQGPKARLTFVEKALRYDRSEAVRLDAAFTLASWSVSAPGIRKVLAEALAAEKSEKVQESLRNYLTPGRVAAPFQKLSGVSP